MRRNSVRSRVATLATVALVVVATAVLRADLWVFCHSMEGLCLSSGASEEQTGTPTVLGHYGYSADALGPELATGTIQAQVPAGSTVVRALLYAATNQRQSPSDDVTVGFENVTLSPVTLSSVTLSLLTHNTRVTEASYRADVTEMVAAKVGSALVGQTDFDFAIDTRPDLNTGLNGVALVVIFLNPAEPESLIYVLDGGLNVSSSPADLSIFFPSPISPTPTFPDYSTTDFSATLSLGISRSNQGEGPGSHTCGTIVGESTIVSVNGQLLTSCAGGSDDGAGTATSEATQITAGGVDDNLNVPDNPAQQPGDPLLPRVDDDELYDITPFFAFADQSIPLTLTTANSGNDQLFLAILKIRANEFCGDVVDNDGDGEVNEGCPLPPDEICNDFIDNDFDFLIDADDPNCWVLDGRMTGGGHVFVSIIGATKPKDTQTKVHVSFELDCDVSAEKPKNHLEVSWKLPDARGKLKEQKFKLTSVTSALCTDNPAFPRPPKKKDPRFNTYAGEGIGTLNKIPGVSVLWNFVDVAEPGKGMDLMSLFIEHPSLSQPLAFDLPIVGGNLKAHAGKDDDDDDDD